MTEEFMSDEETVKAIEKILKDSQSEDEDDKGEYRLSYKEGQQIINYLWDMMG